MLAYLMYNFMNMFALERFMGVFFETRRTAKGLFVLSFILLYILSSFVFVMFNIPALSMFINLAAYYLITLNYESAFKKRLIAVVSIFAIVMAIESVFVAFVMSVQLGSIFEDAGVAEAGQTWAFLVLGLSTYLISLLFRRFSNIKKNTIVSTEFWVSSLAISIASMFFLFSAIAYFPKVTAVFTIAVIFVINMFTFYLHDTLAMAFADKLKVMEEVKERMRVMVDTSPLACIIFEENGSILDINERVLKLFGFSSKQGYMDNMSSLSPERQPDGRLSKEKREENIKRAFKEGSFSIEWLYQLPQGDVIPAELTLERVAFFEQTLVICYIQDLREIKSLLAMKEHLENLAFTDELTGIYNRRYFMNIAEKQLNNCKKDGRPFSIIMLDIDYFKSVNDNYGHLAGDEALKIFAGRLKHVLRKNSLVARYGGEEFIVMLKDASMEDSYETAKRIQDNIVKTPFVIGEISVHITTSIGIATNLNENMELQEIIHNADSAAYKAKELGRNKIILYS